MAQSNIYIGLTAEDLRVRLHILTTFLIVCLLYTSDAADE